jgi:hypothetical protein
MIELFLGGLGLGVAGLIVYLVRRDHLHVDHGVSWILIAIGFAGLGFAPGLVDWVAGKLGVGYPPILGMSLAVVLIAVKMLLMDIDRANLQTRNQRLTQRVAMLEADIAALAGRSEPRADEERTDTSPGKSSNQGAE